MEKKKNNNLIYSILVLLGLLLLILPFWLFDVGSSLNGTNHFVRFGLHIVAFATAIVAGSMVSSAVQQAATSSASSIVTTKVALYATAAIVSTAVVVNTVHHATNPISTSIALNQEKPMDSLLVAKEDSTIVSDSSLASNNQSDTTIASPAVTENSTDNTTASNSEIPKEETSITSSSPTNETIAAAAKTKNTTAKTPTATEKKQAATNQPTTTASEQVLDEVCNSFKIMHGTSLLDRKIGLSIYDPNRRIRYASDCGCVLKDAQISLTRGNKTIDQKIQNGNFVDLRIFKDMLIDDKVVTEIKQATCKNAQGVSFLYTFPKPILSVIFISDSRDYEVKKVEKTATKPGTQQPIDNSIKTSPKDKVEEEMNKYGN